ncbi:MAG TPA: hypothetical protein VGB17_18250 [Pyrinomonadaceae bacterium]|jgi:hypothetical protein
MRMKEPRAGTLAADLEASKPESSSFVGSGPEGRRLMFGQIWKVSI